MSSLREESKTEREREEREKERFTTVTASIETFCRPGDKL